VFDVKVLEADELRAAHTLYRGAIHHPPADEAGWDLVKDDMLPGRTFGAYSGGMLAGMVISSPMPMTVPGGAVLPCAAVTRVGVRADHTRRGALSALMREQLASFVAAGEPIAALHASEYPIYGRFGYGVATRGLSLVIDPRRATLHPGAPTSGQVRLLDRAEMPVVLPEVYQRMLPGRPGMLHRSTPWWRLDIERPGSDTHLLAAVHTGPDGDDGFVFYYPERNPTVDDDWGTRLQVDDLHAANTTAAAALWRFVLGVDVINEVKTWMRPLDDPLPLLLADPRVARTTELSDETWLRLVDVPAALGARSWASSDGVVVAVRDAQLPANSGTYQITPDGVSRVAEPAQLECDVAVLGRLYLGDVAPSSLAATGWLTAHDPAVLPAADALFATGQVPWSGTFF
jgi:predicted acetyltransferase